MYEAVFMLIEEGRVQCLLPEYYFIKQNVNHCGHVVINTEVMIFCEKSISEIGVLSFFILSSSLSIIFQVYCLYL